MIDAVELSARISCKRDSHFSKSHQRKGFPSMVTQETEPKKETLVALDSLEISISAALSELRAYGSSPVLCNTLFRDFLNLKRSLKSGKNPP